MTLHKKSNVPVRLQEGDIGVREFLAFVLGDENYALPLSSIREIMKTPSVTEVPNAPDDILGIISVRGRVTTLINTRRKLSMPREKITSRNRVLLVDKGDEILGLLVDRVLQVYRLREDEVEMASIIGGDLAECVMGIGRPGLSQESIKADEASRMERKRGLVQSLMKADMASDEEILILLDPIVLLKR